ncbi:transcriptional regulator NrdR [Modestobacter marinus]|uniref:transcriptional regulator NrdR n=1 Tax=Modestobacter marinus TaxID=477641 RepID=UPI00201A417F|nr:transcriptional regulator NrdR [Modestobacter marinus]
MRCPFCHNPDSRVIDSRETDEGATTRRRRSCPGCGRRFTTVEEAVLAVVKRSGVSEPFTRGKVVAGVRRACQGRPVDEHQLALLAQQVEDAVRATGCAEIPSHEVGLAILGPLRDLDEVAYLRFASVYRSFSSVADFEKEIAELRGAPARSAAKPSDAKPSDATPSEATPAERGPVDGDRESPATGTTTRRRAAERPRPVDGGSAGGP